MNSYDKSVIRTCFTGTMLMNVEKAYSNISNRVLN